MFQLTRDEIDNLKSQIVTLNTGRGSNIKYLPFAFTEQGCAMLSLVLKSETAVKVSIQIMQAFVSMRHFVQSNSQIFVELKSIREHQLNTDIHLKESDKRIDQLFTLMDKYNVNDTQRSFFFPKSVIPML